tara:strand:- start:1557 stop:1910 length:354 start_codon:yes stop_codon:yes gene_type:complete
MVALVEAVQGRHEHGRRLPAPYVDHGRYALAAEQRCPAHAAAADSDATTRLGCAGGCLCGLAVNELLNVRPMRRKIEQQEKEAAGIASTGSAEPRALPSGHLLMPDGRILTKREQSL